MHELPDVLAAFQRETGRTPDLKVDARGRINIIGEHTDYNDGFVLPGAVDKSIFFAAGRNNVGKVRFWALDLNEYAEMDVAAIRPTDKLWVNYVAGIADQFRQRGHELPGFDLVFGGNLPKGSGMSSSAALETGTALVVNELTGAGLSKPELARLAQRSSHQFVGIPCGIMDQFASLMGEDDAVILLDCRSLDYEVVSSQAGEYEWILINTKVSHELASSEYPTRVAECREGVRILQQYDPSIRALRDVEPALVKAHREEMGEEVFARCLFVTEEKDRTHRAVDCLRQGRWAELGELLFATHAGLRDLYAVSCPELDFLVQKAVSAPGVAGARLMGGGFGGCTINLVHRDHKEAFVSAALRDYETRFGVAAEAYPVHLVQGTSFVN